jgi:hypothetical protein
MEALPAVAPVRGERKIIQKAVYPRGRRARRDVSGRARASSSTSRTKRVQGDAANPGPLLHGLALSACARASATGSRTRSQRVRKKVSQIPGLPTPSL